MKKTKNEQLIHFLSDLYSVELQALVQMKAAPTIAGDPAIAEDFRKHYHETEQHAEMMYERLAAHGNTPSVIKDAIMKMSGGAFLLFALLQPETPGKLLDHAYSYEAMEWAGYEMLLRFAEMAEDYKTVESGQIIRNQELAMMRRVKSRFDIAEEIAHGHLSPDKLDAHLKSHLADVHALVCQSKWLLNKSQEIGGNRALDEIYTHLLDQTKKHEKLIEKLLIERGAHPSKLKDGALTMGGVNWALFFQSQSDTPAKLAAFVYAVLHLEMGGYELLKRTGTRIGDQALVHSCQSILSEKQIMAETVTSSFDTVAKATLDYN